MPIFKGELTLSVHLDENTKSGGVRRACKRGERHDARRTASRCTAYRIHNTLINRGTSRGPLFLLGDWGAAPHL